MNTPVKLKRPGYREAVEWLALNDESNCLSDPAISVSAAMVRDLWGVPEAKLIDDLRKFRVKKFPKSAEK